MMMSNIEQKDPRFKNLEKKVGIFVFTAFVILAGILFFMGRERGLFIKKYFLLLIAAQVLLKAYLSNCWGLRWAR